MRTFILIGCLILSGLQLSAQKLVNYDQNGDKLKSVAEYVDISIKNEQLSSDTKLGATILAGVILGPVYNILSSTIKSVLEKRQKSYTASYSNSKQFLSESFKKAGSKSLIISRYAINSLEEISNERIMAKYEFALVEEENSISIEIKNVCLNRSKARYKKDDNLAITINIKATSTTISSKIDSDTKENKSESKTVESDGTITIPIFKVTGDTQDLQNKGNVINKIRLNGISLSTSNSIKFSVSISETNITRIDPSVVQTILTNNNSDIQSILKTIFGVAQK